jgi:hypothetical protein
MTMAITAAAGLVAAVGLTLAVLPDQVQTVESTGTSDPPTTSVPTGTSESPTTSVPTATSESTSESTGESTSESTGATDEAQPEPSLLAESDFSYLGAFLLPAGDYGPSRFAFGGGAAAYWADGDPDSSDGYDGSLFVSGHPRLNPGVAEVSIPEPGSHDGSTEGLPVATVLQPFADITAGRGLTYVGSQAVGGQDEFRYGGLEVVDGESGPRLHWAIWQYGNVADNQVPGHGHSSLDLDAPDPQGPWFLDGRSSRSTGGFVFSVPTAFADQYLDGRRLLAGQQDGATSQADSVGPPFHSFSPPQQAGPGADVDAVRLAHYDPDRPLPGFGLADTAAGAAWVERADGANAVVTVGRRGLGQVRYGEPGQDDCGINAGQHAGPYEPLVMFYDPDDLAALATGELEPWELAPYRTWNPSRHLIPTCDWHLTSIMFDPEAGLIYIVQPEADTSQNEFSPIPVVHVFAL